MKKTAALRFYTKQWGITEDYAEVRAFLIKASNASGILPMTYARWDWATTHSYLERENVGRMGLWEAEGELVAAALFDGGIGDTFLVALPGWEGLYPELIAFAERNLTNPKDGTRLCIDNGDFAQQSAAAGAGYAATDEAEDYALFRVEETPLDYTLPQGFHISDMQKDFDLVRYGECLWKGFNHELNGEGVFSPAPDREEDEKLAFFRPNVDRALKINVVAPNGDFAAHCGMWYDAQAGFAVVEPVATAPQYRKLGLGRAAVLEGIARCAQRGAKVAQVGSNQAFYYHLGFRPYKRGTFWQKK